MKFADVCASLEKKRGAGRLLLLGAISSEHAGAAAANLGLQVPLIMKSHPKEPVVADLADAHRGTINVRLCDPSVSVIPEFSTASLPWEKNGAPEAFGFTRVQFFLVRNRAAIHEAWIYLPARRMHGNRVVEVIARDKITRLQDDLLCGIIIVGGHVSRFPTNSIDEARASPGATAQSLEYHPEKKDPRC